MEQIASAVRIFRDVVREIEMPLEAVPGDSMGPVRARTAVVARSAWALAAATIAGEASIVVAGSVAAEASVVVAALAAAGASGAAAGVVAVGEGRPLRSKNTLIGAPT